MSLSEKKISRAHVNIKDILEEVFNVSPYQQTVMNLN